MTMDASELALVADIGGTNVRFALARPERLELEQIRVMPGQDFASLEQAIAQYLKDLSLKDRTISRACLAIAGPAEGDPIRLTNRPWTFSRTELQKQLGLREIRVINDLMAMALGAPTLGRDQQAFLGGRMGGSRQRRLVIAAGTGLGMALLVWRGGHWTALATEGGHVDFAPVNEREFAIFRRLADQFGHVSVERILSGQGLLNLYRSLADIEAVKPVHAEPKEITRAAVEGGDRLARETLALFCEIFGRVAGNAVLTMGAWGGVYIGGGILSNYVEFLRQSRFREAFLDKGRMRPLLEPIPVQVLLEPFVGLMGAAQALNLPEESHPEQAAEPEDEITGSAADPTPWSSSY